MANTNNQAIVNLPNNIKLKKINLLKADKNECQDINVGDEYLYLVKIDAIYYVGYFSKTYLGLTFNKSEQSYERIQFSAPGYNSSLWQSVWEIIEK